MKLDEQTACGLPSPIGNRAISFLDHSTPTFPLDIDPQPCPIVSLIAEALGLCCKGLGLLLLSQGT